MQIVIEIDDKEYEEIIYFKNTRPLDLNHHEWTIAKGTPLPKGHGRLIDEEMISLSGIHFETELDHARMIGRLNTASTIIEADKAESEDKE